MKKAETPTVAPGSNARALRAIAIVAVFAVVVLVVSYELMTLGYVLLVAALSTFFLIVAFDVGVSRDTMEGPSE